MKKLLLTVVLSAAVAFAAAAQSTFCHFGVQAGLSFNSLLHMETKTGWHAGLTMEWKLPAYFALQPSVLFNQAFYDAELKEEPKEFPGIGTIVTIRQDQITIPLVLQWGPDLGVLRPFIEVVPYVDINLNSQAKIDSWQDVKDAFTTAQFGTGVGGGIDVWRIQISARYNWMFGDWATLKSGDWFKNNTRRGVTLSLVYFFH